jgi:hypothetical protein
MKKRIITLFGVLVIFGTPTLAQNRTFLEGNVVSEAGETIEFYTLVLQSAADSSVVAVEMFSDTAFRFGGIKPQTYILRLQDVRYQPYDTLIAIAEGANVLTAPLVLKPKALGEVVVKGSRPVLSYNQGNLTVDVANSYLKDDISLESILVKLPGVTVDNKGSIGMFGKDKLLIYINDMELRSQEELKSLQPADIDKIEIIRNAGSEYAADVDAVIKIRTRKKRDEKIFISLNDNLMIRHYLENGSNLSLYLGHNEKLSQYITYNNGFGKIRGHSRSYIYTYFDDYRNCNFRDDYTVYKGTSNNLFYSLNYSISKNKELGVQYSGYFDEGMDNRTGTRLIYHDEELNKTVDLNSKETDKQRRSTVNLNYRQQINDMSELSVIADYVISNRYETTDITESSIDMNANNIINTDNDGKVISINPEYKISWKKYTGNFGLKYSYLTSSSTVEFRSAPNEDYSQVSEHAGGAYMTFDADLSFVDIKSGLRLEYTGSDIRYDNRLDNLTRNRLNLFPHISISKTFNDHLNMTVYYRRTISRPSIYMLRSTIIYRDSLHYATGNPQLKPTMIDALNFNVNYRGFDFSLGYRIYKDQSYWDAFPDSENPNRTIDTYGNRNDRDKVLTAELSYSLNHSVFSSMTSVSCRKSDLSLLFNNEMIRFNRPSYSIKHSGDLKFPTNTSLSYFFRYSTPGDRGYIRTKSHCNLSADITQHLLNRKLMISLSVEDILKTNRKSNRWTSYTNNIAITQDDNWPDTRYVTLTVRYNLGVKKSIQKQTSDTDHIGRL